jgi:hypothetical protein
MGSSGMKRKGRRHIPKVGTPAEQAHELEERRELALHPFSSDPRGRGVGWVSAVVVAVIVVIGVIAIIIAT